MRKSQKEKENGERELRGKEGKIEQGGTESWGGRRERKSRIEER